MGERYLHYAEKIVEYGLEWDTELDDIMHQNHGRLNIAIPIMLGNSIIGPTLPRFHKQFPHVTVNMMEEVNFVAEHTLNDHTVDLTFYNVHEYPRDLDYQILGKEEMVLVLSASSPAASKAVEREGFKYPWLDLRLLCGEDFILLYPDQNTGGIAPETVFRIWNGTSYPDAHPQQRDVHPPGHGRHGRGLRTRELLPLFKETVQFSPCACFSIGNEKIRKHPDRSLSRKTGICPSMRGFTWI